MLGKLSIIGAVGAILLMPTTLPAQARGAAVAGAVGRGIPTGLGRHHSNDHHTPLIIGIEPPHLRADDGGRAAHQPFLFSRAPPSSAARAARVCEPPVSA
jgi:hypothetical protein